MKPADWRKLDDGAASVIRAIAAELPDPLPVLEDLESAESRNQSSWILEIRVSGGGPKLSYPDGPLPVEALIPDEANYQGEIIVWVTGGHLSGLEYAWVTDETPVEWPKPDRMQVRSRR